MLIHCTNITGLGASQVVQILKGVVPKDHIHMHIEYRPFQDVSTLVKLMKGRSSRKLQIEFPT